MNTGRKLNNPAIIAFLLMLALTSACKNRGNDPMDTSGQESIGDTIYTCPMDPEVISVKPGTCPKCKMFLEPTLNENLVQTVSPNQQVLSRQATLKMVPAGESPTLRAQGYIDYDRTRDQSVSVRFSGRIEKLFVKYDLQYLNKGDKIAEIYSPDLNTFQEEHLFLLKQSGERALLEKSRQKLSLMGLTDAQIARLEQNGVITPTITLFSPAAGYALLNSPSGSNSDPSEPQSGSGMSMAPESNPEKSFPYSGAQIREGMYLNKGETILILNDLKALWAMVSLPSGANPVIDRKIPITLTSELFPDRKLSGRVILAEQNYEETQQRFDRLRIALPNPDGQLKINSLLSAEIPLEITGNFQIPASAVYRTGMGSVVWVKTGETSKGTGIFQVRKVSTGAFIKGMTTIISGLSAHEEIAQHAGYMTDSETFNEN